MISTLSEWGLKEIAIAETEMPGLMALRQEYKNIKPLTGGKNCRMSSHDNSNCCPH